MAPPIPLTSSSLQPQLQRRSFAENVGPVANAEIVLPVLTTAVVVFRIWLRKRFAIKLWWDDYSVAIAQPLMFGTYFLWWYACTFIVWKQRITELDEETRVKFLRVTFKLLFFYCAGNFAVKSSILFLYWRAFTSGTSKAVRYILYILFFVNFALLVNRVVGSIVFCNPVSNFWNAPQKCSSRFNGWSIAGESIALVQELTLLIFPIPIIWRMRAATTRSKFAIYAAFTAGGMTVLCHVVRIVMLRLGQFTVSRALADAEIPALVFLSLLEHLLGTVAVSFPALHSPIRILIRNARGSDTREPDPSENDGFSRPTETAEKHNNCERGVCGTIRQYRTVRQKHLKESRRLNDPFSIFTHAVEILSKMMEGAALKMLDEAAAADARIKQHVFLMLTS